MQKPLAVVVIGGLISATILTLLVLPAISRLMLDSGRSHPATLPLTSEPALAE